MSPQHDSLPALDLGAPQLTRRLLTGTHLHTYHGCSHALYLEFTRARSEKLPPTEEVALLLERGRAHEEQIVAALEVVEPRYQVPDWEAGAERTRELMRAGHPWIFQAVLHRPPYLGLADLLRRVERPSALGAWSYEVLDIKSSRKAKLEQLLQVSLYSLVLAAEQELEPREGALILADGREQRFALDDLRWTLLDILDEIGELLSGRRASHPHRTARCEGCPWRGLCLPAMESSADITLLPRISRARAARLRRAGIHDLRALRERPAAELLEADILPAQTLRQLRLQARALLEDTRLPTGQPPRTIEYPALAWTLERDPFREEGLFLYRAAALVPGGDSERLRLLVRDESGERTSLRAFLEWIAARAFRACFHYGAQVPELLVDARRRLAPEIPLPEQLESDSHDLRNLWSDHLALPVATPALYTIGRHLGTHQEVPGGIQRALWWETYRQSGEERWRERVEESDERDIATMAALLALIGGGGEERP